MESDRYPRMIFRGDETGRADSRDELLAKREQGWHATLLPGETPEDIGETSADEITKADADVTPKRGRKPKADADVTPDPAE